mgnify:CR=1 FL=1
MKSIYLLLFLSVLLTGTTCLGQNKNTVIVNGIPWFDDRGNIGKRYRRQDEIGTPFCVTYDFDSEEDGAVTVRDRDTMEQERVKIEDLKAYFEKKFEY